MSDIPRYIDADALKTDILMKYKKNWEVPCSSEDRIVQRVVTDLRVLIEKNTPADVVPRAEVARIFEEIEQHTKDVGFSSFAERFEFADFIAELKKKYAGNP